MYDRSHARTLREEYGIQSELLPHCIADRDLDSAPTALRPPQRQRPTVLFVGAVSDAMNLDALKVLAEASELLPQDYILLFCTSSSREHLGSLGIRSSRLQVQYVSRHEVQRLQGEVDVLVAPLSHKNGSPDEVRTVFSTKLLEYLIAGRPIVVFAPHDSYHATSAQKGGWGYVVTEDSPQALAAAIQQVARDTTLAASLVQGALREAHTRRASHHANRLYEWVQETQYTRMHIGLTRSLLENMTAMTAQHQHRYPFYSPASPQVVVITRRKYTPTTRVEHVLLLLNIVLFPLEEVLPDLWF